MDKDEIRQTLARYEFKVNDTPIIMNPDTFIEAVEQTSAEDIYSVVISQHGEVLENLNFKHSNLPPSVIFSLLVDFIITSDTGLH